MQGKGAEYPPGFRQGGAEIDGAKLSVYTFQQQGVLEEGAVERLTKDVHRRVTEWWANNGGRTREFTGNTTTGTVLAAVDDVSCSSRVRVL